jgi:pyruvate kinase
MNSEVSIRHDIAPIADDSANTLREIARDLHALRDAMLSLEAEQAELVHAAASEHRVSATNLLHYLALRRCDLRGLQGRLAAQGLSSLGRAEAHSLSTVCAVLEILQRLMGTRASVRTACCDIKSGADLLDKHASELLGPEPAGRSVRIMVTMPSEAAGDYTVIRKLLDAGMDCMRINCAHDDSPAWLRMIEHLRQAREASGRPCSVLMDVAGPKLRTGAIEAGPAVLKIRPGRDKFGRTTAPAAVWLTSADAPAAPPSGAAAAVLHTGARWLAALRPAERLTFRDARGRRRVLHVVDRDRHGVWVELRRTAYITNGTKLRRSLSGTTRPKTSDVGGIEPLPGSIHLTPGDVLLLTGDRSPGRSPTFDSAGRMLSTARIGCTLPEVLAQVKAGERVCLDDGKITGVAESVTDGEIRVRVQGTPSGGARLRADKGINFPDSHLQLPAITEKDRADLKFVAQHADMIGLSFANHETDVSELIGLLREYGPKRPGIVLKIETQHGFARLPALLLTAMRHERFGVMIARGDLAVECGYQRLAEAQEEILWLCEAAHCPAIWATEVLDNLAKEGRPSRAEVTDAAMGHRAECVMLNKGPHIEEAVRALDDILKRMETHQSKKTAMLRALRLATEFHGVQPQAVSVRTGSPPEPPVGSSSMHSR